MSANAKSNPVRSRSGFACATPPRRNLVRRRAPDRALDLEARRPGHGGRVESPIGDPFDLPDRDFRIVMVDLHGTVIEPKQLQEISKLEYVRELYVPARVWSPVSDVKAPFSDESFQYYQGMKQLETFSAGLTTLAWLDIGDEGVKRLSSALPAQTSPAEQHHHQGSQVFRSARQSGVSRSWRRLRAGLFAGSAGQHEEPEAPEPSRYVGYR